MADVTCPYCGNPAQLVTGEAVYPHRADLWEKKFYQCKPCGARVGCHPGTEKPFGRLANAELRRAKIDAHAAFDKLWKSGKMTRSSAYALLRSLMELKKGVCHIGMFDEVQCRMVGIKVGNWLAREAKRRTGCNQTPQV